MSEFRAFEPQYAPTGASGAQGTLLPSTTIAASVVAATNTAAFAGVVTNYKTQILVSNQTTAWAFVNFGVVGNVAVATVATGLPVPPGVGRVFTVDKEVTAASVILAAGGTAGNVTFTRGEGL